MKSNVLQKLYQEKSGSLHRKQFILLVSILVYCFKSYFFLKTKPLLVMLIEKICACAADVEIL